MYVLIYFTFIFSQYGNANRKVFPSTWFIKRIETQIQVKHYVENIQIIKHNKLTNLRWYVFKFLTRLCTEAFRG